MTGIEAIPFRYHDPECNCGKCSNYRQRLQSGNMHDRLDALYGDGRPDEQDRYYKRLMRKIREAP
jgi:hypothetical protein